MAIDIAIVGATGLVGKTMLTILLERKLPVNKIYVLASSQSSGNVININKESFLVEDLKQFDFSKVKLAFFSAGSTVSKIYAPKAVECGCIVIDNTSLFRNEDDIPLVVPEINPDAIANYKKRGIIANPNCSTIQMLVALNPIHHAVRITRINVSTYQSVSGAGQNGITELIHQTGKLLNGVNAEPQHFSQQIGFNVIPHIDTFQDNGYTREEMKMVWETRKILNDASIQINPTCVRVPVFYGHAEAIHIETEHKITANEAQKLLEKAPGVEVLDKPSKYIYPTPVQNATGTDSVYVGRIREDIFHKNGLNMWVVSDNVRKGAALNSIQIAEQLVSRFMEC